MHLLDVVECELSWHHHLLPIVVGSLLRTACVQINHRWCLDDEMILLALALVDLREWYHLAGCELLAACGTLALETGNARLLIETFLVFFDSLLGFCHGDDSARVLLFQSDTLVNLGQVASLFLRRARWHRRLLLLPGWRGLD